MTETVWTENAGIMLRVEDKGFTIEVSGIDDKGKILFSCKVAKYRWARIIKATEASHG